MYKVTTLEEDMAELGIDLEEAVRYVRKKRGVKARRARIVRRRKYKRQRSRRRRQAKRYRRSAHGRKIIRKHTRILKRIRRRPMGKIIRTASRSEIANLNETIQALLVRLEE